MTVVYVYYRVAAGDCDAAVASVLAAQAALTQQYPGAVFELLRRPGHDTDGCVTLMETMRLPDGVDAAAVESVAADASRPWLRGQRHVEVFEPVSRSVGGSPAKPQAR